MTTPDCSEPTPYDDLVAVTDHALDELHRTVELLTAGPEHRLPLIRKAVELAELLDRLLDASATWRPKEPTP